MATDSARAAIESFRASTSSNSEKLKILSSMAADLPSDKRVELAQTLLFGRPPGAKIADTLYLLVIGALLFILLACAGVLTGIVPTPDPDVTMDRVLGIFTTVLSFIIGLFVPSPTASRNVTG